VEQVPGEKRPAPLPSGEPPRRWGLGDFLWIYVAGILISVVGVSIGLAITGDEAGHAGAVTTALAAFGQFGGWVACIAYVAHAKGRSLRDDFGLRLDVRDWWAVFAGMGLFVVATLLILPLHDLVNESQRVVDDLNAASGAKLVVFAVVAALVAPVSEELLFRGLLLRALRRRFPPAIAIGVQALVFALAHPLLSPTLGDLAVVPALFLLGVASGLAAETKGDLSASILMHIGFNLITTLAAF
jgi:membrane protease YdiL (CAAX protease family)